MNFGGWDFDSTYNAFFPAVLKEHFLLSNTGGTEVVKGRSLLSELNLLRTIKELNAVFLLDFSPPNFFSWYKEVSNRLNVSLPMLSMCVDDIFGLNCVSQLW